MMHINNKVIVTAYHHDAYKQYIDSTNLSLDVCMQ